MTRLLIASPWGSAANPKTLSGFPYYLVPRLREHFDITVADRDSSPVEFSPIARVQLRIQKALSNWRPYRFPGARDVIARSFSAWLTRESVRHRPDAVLTFGCAPVAYYAADAPVFLYIDALYLYKARVYGWISEASLPDYELKSMRRIDDLGLENCARALFTSATIAAESREMFPAHASKITSVGIGANLDEEVAPVGVRPSDATGILFMSTNFERKGGRFALHLLRLLRGVIPSVRLHIVGDFPDQEETSGENVVYHGWIDKSSPGDLARLRRILEGIHLSILPTHGDLSPHSICEMNALGIPTVARRVAGIPDLIEDGATGRVIDDWDEQKWISAILDVLDRLDEYSTNARILYDREQRWPEVASRIAREIESGVRERAGD